jgi:hypothetical protein
VLRSLLLLSLLAVSPPAGQVMELLPVDEASEDPSFLAFRDSLTTALEVNDTTFVFGRTQEDVFNGFGGDGGIDELREFYWGEDFRLDLLTTLNLGGRFSPADELGDGVAAQFVAPYTYDYPPTPDDWPDAFDWYFETSAVVVVPTEVVGAPGGEVLATLGHSIVIRSDWWPAVNPDGIQEPVWSEVRLADGRVGYALAENLRGGSDFRAFFEKHDGAWVFTGWAAGD